MARDRPGGRSSRAWFGAAFLLAGVLELTGAWRMIRHHGGALLVVLPVVPLVLLSALLARRARRGEGG